MNAIYFDMDGTIANLYGNPNWLTMLRSYDPTPYATATPLVNMNSLARKLNALRKAGWHIGIVSWLSKESTTEYDMAVTEAKKRWLDKHLHSVKWDEIVIVPYGTPKQNIVNYPLGILFDDEERNRKEWTGTAYDVDEILATLRSL